MCAYTCAPVKHVAPVNSQIRSGRRQTAKDVGSTYRRLSRRVDWPTAPLFQVATPADRRISYSVNSSGTDCQTCSLAGLSAKVCRDPKKPLELVVSNLLFGSTLAFLSGALEIQYAC